MPDLGSAERPECRLDYDTFLSSNKLNNINLPSMNNCEEHTKLSGSGTASSPLFIVIASYLYEIFE